MMTAPAESSPGPTIAERAALGQNGRMADAAVPMLWPNIAHRDFFGRRPERIRDGVAR